MLSEFHVKGLHGSVDLLVRIKNDRLIIVGENGTGKSTLVNLIYYFITCQWNRLLEFKFKTIRAAVGGADVEITHQMLEQFQERRVNFSRNFPSSLVRLVRSSSAEQQLNLFADDDEVLRQLAKETHYPISIIRQLVRELRAQEYGTDPVSAATAVIRAARPGQVLYLPTYRRIEQDLQSIFRGIDLEAQLTKLREQIGHGRSKGGFVELVEFGMHDVESTVRTRLATVKDALREGLSNLTASYLRDVIRGAHKAASNDTVLALNRGELNAILARLDEATLQVADKEQLMARVTLMQQKAHVTSDDSVVVHFLSKLMELQRAQEQEERVLERFVTTCNKYLVGKSLHFDNTNYKISIKRTINSKQSLSSHDSDLAFKSLSSGEKQIVSLFSHIYLSGKAGFYVIIDEPELSLSVPWQRQFLPDILATEMCFGLLAVTHSPFVWENDLEREVRSMADFAEAARVAN